MLFNRMSDTMNPQWRTGLYSCTADPLECCDCMLCCWCELSRQAEATLGNSNKYSIAALFASFPFFSCMYYVLRRRVVDKYHIEEATWLSLATIAVCGACSTCQVHRELTIRQVWPGGTLPCLHNAPTNYAMML